jgi:tol-pal system protein YbgF
MTRFSFLLVPLCLLAAGCASAGPRASDVQQQEIQTLKARILELQREAAMNQVELAQLRQQIAELEARQGGSRPAAPSSRPAALPSSSPPPARPAGEPPRTTVAPSRPAPVAAAPEVRREPSRPTIAPPSREPAAVEEPIEEVDIDLPESAPAPPSRRIPLPAPAPVTPPAAQTESPGEESAGETLSPANQVLYDRGYSLYYQGHFVDAETSFQRFLQANPASELADNAQYWIGECRYARNDLKGALAAFRETVERYPKGNKVGDAMFKAGQCLEGLGDIEGARVTYREVVRRFAGTSAAAAAEERRVKLP